MYRFFRPWLFLILSAGCTSKTVEYTFEAEDFLEPVRTLSSDAFEGRAPATPGEEKTIAYLQDQFSAYGLQPGFDGEWIQPVPATGYKVNSDSTFLSHSTLSGKPELLPFRTSMMAWPASNEAELDFSGLELVYVGYGIVAPEENWDDYKGADLSGKVLVFKNSDPYTNEERFKGTTRLYYGRYDYKYEIAARLGARGALIIHTLPTAGYPWTVVANSWEKEQFRLKSAAAASSGTFNGWLTLEASEKMFREAGLNLAALLDSAESPSFKPVPLKNVRLSGSIRSRFRELAMKNIAAMLPGTDPAGKNEYLIFTAHHDHLGIGTPVQGDSVFNGALDNATGVSALLNLARAHAESGPARRSMIFMAVSGEEKGLLGAKHAAVNLPVSHASVLLNINIDGLNINGRTRDLVSIGLGRSSIDSLLQATAQRQKRYVRPDPRPELGYFYRSDHFAFAKTGIPVLYINAGRDFVDKPADFYDTTVNQFLSERYHTVFDEINPQWDVTGALQDLSLLFDLSRTLANGRFRPAWNPGDEFESARLHSLSAVK